MGFTWKDVNLIFIQYRSFLVEQLFKYYNWFHCLFDEKAVLFVAFETRRKPAEFLI